MPKPLRMNDTTTTATTAKTKPMARIAACADITRSPNRGRSTWRVTSWWETGSRKRSRVPSMMNPTKVPARLKLTYQSENPKARERFVVAFCTATWSTGEVEA